MIRESSVRKRLRTERVSIIPRSSDSDDWTAVCKPFVGGEIGVLYLALAAW